MNRNFDKSTPAVVLGLFDTGLGAVRSLGRLGIKVYGYDHIPSQVGFKSRYCRSKLCPDPVHKPLELLDFLESEAKRFFTRPVVFPTADAYVLFLSQYRDELKDYFRFNLPHSNIVESIIDKSKQYKLAEELSVPCPETYYPESVEQLMEIVDELPYPVLIKPIVSHIWQEKFPETKGIRADNKFTLIERFKEVNSLGIRVMVQEIIIGPNTNHFKVSAYYSASGELVCLITLRKIRQYPVDFGVGTITETIKFPELVQLGRKFFEGIGYKGIGSIEFKKDDKDGILKMIELNPRLWQQNIQANDAGINFPLIQYLDLTDQPVDKIFEFKTGVRWFDLTDDFLSFLEYKKRGELTLWEWIKSWKNARSFPRFAVDDIHPFLYHYRYGFIVFKFPKILLKNFFKKNYK